MFIILFSLAVISVWLPTMPIRPGLSVPVWPLFFTATCVVALMSGVVDPVGVVALIGFILLVWVHAAPVGPRWLRPGIFLLTLVYGLALALHKIPGFHNPIMIEAVRFSPDATPFTQYANLDKGVVGLALLALLCPIATTQSDWRAVIRKATPIFAGMTLGIFALALVLGYVRFDAKLPAYTLVFLLLNLFFVSVAEEAFFRGLVQSQLSCWLKRLRYGETIAIIFSGALFGAAHLGGGSTAAFLATLAGLGYAATYSTTKKIEGPILAHFGFNAIHFILFTYPSIG